MSGEGGTGTNAFPGYDEVEALRLAVLSSPVGMAINSIDGCYLTVNDAFCRLVGRSAGQLQGMRWDQITHPDDLTLDSGLTADVAAGRRDSYRLLKRYLLPDDRVVWAEISVSGLRGPNGKVEYLVCQMVDQSEAVMTSRALGTTLAGTATLIHAHDDEQLLRDMCAAVVAAGDYLCCWYGLRVEDPARTVRRVALAGEDRGYLESIVVSWDAESPLGQGPTGRALRTGATQVGNHLSADPTFVPWAEAAASRGIRASIAVPVRVDDRIHGALTVYADEPDAFGPQALQSLEDLASDLGFGLERLAASRRLADAEQRFRLMAENAADVVIHTDSAGVIDWVSPSVTVLLGWEPAECIGQLALDLIAAEDVGMVLESRQAPGESVSALLVRALRKDGGWVWVDSRAHWIDTDRPRGGGRVIAWRDVSDQVALEAELREQRAKFQLLAENSMDMVMSTDLRAVITWVSPSVTTVLGYLPEELIGRPASVTIDPRDEEVLQAAEPAIREGLSTTTRLRFRTKLGHPLWVELSGRALRDGEGTLVGRVVAVRDIDAEVRTAEALEREVDFDALTGLAKHRLAVARIEELVAANRTSDCYLICAGINGLTAINHAYKYAAGDEALREMARRLVEAAGAHDRVARVAGDEFLIFLPDVGSPTEAADAAERLLAAVNGPVRFGDVEVNLTASIGITRCSGTDADHLLREATAAMRQARGKGPGRWEFLDGDVASATRASLELAARLRQALADDRLVPWLMPICDLAGGRLRGYEALVRWVEPDGSIFPPEQFLQVAEQTHLIIDVDRVVLHKSLTALSRLPDEVHVAVNVSAATLTSGQLESWVRAGLERTGVDPARLHLEVTETDLFRPNAEVIASMRSLAGLGVAWWMDDFGTGFSSVAHLRDLPISGLKLDVSYTRRVCVPEDNARQIALGLVGLARGLGLSTVAEGIETPEEEATLRDQGWDSGQGYRYGKPAPIPPDPRLPPR